MPPRLLSTGDAAALRDARTADIVAAPTPVLARAAAAVGHTQTLADGDGTVRSDAAALRVGEDTLLPSLATAIAARAFGVAPAELTFAGGRRLHLGERVRPLSTALTIRPHYFPTTPPQFTQYPYWRVLAGDVPVEQLRDKIVIVGFLDSSLAAPGTVTTPASDASPAVLTAASTVTSIVEGKVYSRPTYAIALEWIVAVAVIAFAAFVLPMTGATFGALASVLFIVILGVTEIGLLSSSQVWVRFMLPGIALVIGYGLYLPGELMRRATSRSEDAKNLSASSLRNLGQTFQRQGQLDLAFETYRRCPLDAATMELLYLLGNDFEKRRQMQKASNVYSYIAARDPNYRDLRARRARLKEQPLTRGVAPHRRHRRLRNRALRRSSRRSPPIRIWHIRRRAHARATRALGRYEIERELGKGAMGTVYLGRDPEDQPRGGDQGDSARRGIRGGRSGRKRARASSARPKWRAGSIIPAIVTVYDAGEDQGLAYIAMEYLRGQHLSHFTEAGACCLSKT